MIAIVGPTSSGKTSLALKLCKQFGGEIISADSRQIYRNMDYGTGKIPVNEDIGDIERLDGMWLINGVSIYLYDVIDPNQEYSAFKFRGDALEIVKKIENDGKIPFVVGGTGFYISALLFDMIEASTTKIDAELRSKLESNSTDELQQLLPKSVLSNMNDSDRQNPRRLIRKIELMKSALDDISPIGLKSTGKDDLIIRLTAPREVLYKRVDLWVDKSFGKIVDETKKLISGGYGESRAVNGIIYCTAKDLIEERIG